MRITEQDKRTFKKVVDFMQRMDQNGVYYTILEDLEYINPKELIAEILETFKQWKSDINSYGTKHIIDRFTLGIQENFI